MIFESIYEAVAGWIGGKVARGEITLLKASISCGVLFFIASLATSLLYYGDELSISLLLIGAGFSFAVALVSAGLAWSLLRITRARKAQNPKESLINPPHDR
ncbi:MAG: hypothetical protein JJT85_06430 [Chromatiales bacterium]|nr:hypothetical protein [Chromatiales bacterium]